MKKIILLYIIIQTNFICINSQALPIGIDGQFYDWLNSTETYFDSQNDGADYDMLSFSVSNDSSFLYIRIALSDEILLNDDNQLFLQIDTDNDEGTGYPVNGIGSELGIDFGNRTAYFTPESSSIPVYHDDIMLRALPTVTSDSFEISIGRHVYPDGTHPLFTSSTIKLCFIDNDSGGDEMPDNGSTFTYTFDESDVGEYSYINFDKNNNSDIRIMTYNTLSDGLIDSDPNRVNAFKRIITAVDPDIITFNECWDTEWYEARDLLNDWLPITGGTWECWKIDYGNITCSKFNISDNYSVFPGHRITASLIDLPESYPKDIMIINAHFKASGGYENNQIRQEEADAVIAFLKDVKSPGGAITLPYGTPFVISGDLNLVGYSQQLTTLISGDIVNNAVYGEDQFPDWDETDLKDVISLHTDQRMAYTWESNYSSFWPGRLDYAICTDIGSTVSNMFTVNTLIMSPDRLLEFNLLQNDTYTASDHLPKVTDLIIEDVVENVNEISNTESFAIFPNPSPTGKFIIESKNKNRLKNIRVFNLTGQEVLSISQINSEFYDLNISGFQSGIYFIEIRNEKFNKTYKIIK